MKRRLLSTFLALCIIISFPPSTLAANLPEVDVRTEGLTLAQPQESAPVETPAQPQKAPADEVPANLLPMEAPAEEDTEAVSIDLSKGRIEITDTGYKQYETFEASSAEEIPHTGSYILTGNLGLENWSTYKRIAVRISSDSDKTFDITLKDLTVTLTHSYETSGQVYNGLIQVDSGSLDLTVEGTNLLTAKATGDKDPSRPSIACGAPIIRVMKGDLTLRGDGTLTLDNQDSHEDRDFSGGIQILAGSMTVDMEGTLNIHVAQPSASHITCGETDQSVQGLPGMDEDDPDQGNLLIQAGTINVGGEAEDGLEPGTGIIAGRKLEISGGTVNVISEKATLCAAAPGSGNFGTLMITGADTVVTVKNSVDKDYYRAVAVKENMTVDGGATLAITANGAAKGIVVGETQAPEPFLHLGESHITINTASDCMELYCSLTIDDSAILDLTSSKANGIHNRVDYNRSNAYPSQIQNCNLTISAAKYGIYYQVSNNGSKLEFGGGADVTIGNGSSGIYSAADIIIGGDAQINVDGSFNSGGIVGKKNIAVEDNAFVKVLNSYILSDAIKADGNITIDCEELVASSRRISKACGITADSITISNMNYVPLEEDEYYVGGMGERNKMYTDTADTTAQMSGTHSSPYLHVKEAYLTIKPADITVYTGGDGYESVVGTPEHPTDPEKNGLPEAGFWFTIPDTVNEALNGKALAEDLTPYLTFTYDDGHETTRTWAIEKYSPDGTSTTDLGDGIDRYIYRIVPAQGQDPIRLQFKDDHGNTIVSDEFDVSAIEQNRTYSMTIYSGGVDQDLVKAVFKDIPEHSDETFIYPVKIEEGALTIRGATEVGVTAPVEDKADDVTGDAITAVAPADVTYYVNDSQVEITDKNAVHLLTDEVLDDQVLIDHISDAIIGSDTGIPEGDYLYEFQYLDLVDSTNGNAYVTLGDGQTIDLYWPVPADADTSEPFYIVHFDALDRDYEGAADEQLKENPAEKLDGTLVTLNGKQYIKFATGSFSPFALVYQKESGGGDHGGGGGTTYYTLRYESNGGTKYKDERYRRNTLVELDKEPVREGYTFTGWYADKALTEPIDDIRMTSNKTVYAGWEKTGVPDRLNGDDHFAYIIGRDDGLVHPEAPITRAEVATIFFRLLTDEARDEYLTGTSPFADVASDAWYATAVATMQAMGIVEGRSPSAFDPEAPITRGEFAAIAARFDSDPYHGDDRFTDISGHWAAGYINQAAVKGWVEGQPDGSFAPDRSITRAEAMTTINRVLGRLPETADDLLDDMIAWPDNPPDAWYYLAVQEATNSHDYERKADTVHETWTGLQPAGNWAQYQ